MLVVGSRFIRSRAINKKPHIFSVFLLSGIVWVSTCPTGSLVNEALADDFSDSVGQSTLGLKPELSKGGFNLVRGSGLVVCEFLDQALNSVPATRFSDLQDDDSISIADWGSANKEGQRKYLEYAYSQQPSGIKNTISSDEFVKIFQEYFSEYGASVKQQSIMWADGKQSTLLSVFGDYWVLEDLLTVFQISQYGRDSVPLVLASDGTVYETRNFSISDVANIDGQVYLVSEAMAYVVRNPDWVNAMKRPDFLATDIRLEDLEIFEFTHSIDIYRPEDTALNGKRNSLPICAFMKGDYVQITSPANHLSDELDQHD